MAQYLMSVLTETGELATPEEMARIDEFNDRMRADGSWVFAGGLAAPATATVVDGREGPPILTDGPYVETKEFVIGLWVVDAPDLDAALKLAAEGSRACGARVELRPFL
jgi:hypothetical protein